MRGERLLRARALALGSTQLSCHLPKARAQMNKPSVHPKQEHTVQHSKTPSASVFAAMTKRQAPALLRGCDKMCATSPGGKMLS